MNAKNLMNPLVLILVFNLVACGKGSHEIKDDYTHYRTVHNNSNYDMRVWFTGSYASYCKKGNHMEEIPARSTKFVKVSFESCSNGGGEDISGVSLDQPSTSDRYSVDCYTKDCVISRIK